MSNHLKVTIGDNINNNAMTITPTIDGWELRYSFELLEKIEAQALKDGKRFTEKFKEIDDALNGFLEVNDISQKVLKQISDYMRYGSPLNG